MDHNWLGGVVIHGTVGEHVPLSVYVLVASTESEVSRDACPSTSLDAEFV